MSLGTDASANGRGTCAIQARQGGNRGDQRAPPPPPAPRKQPHQSTVTLKDQWKKYLSPYLPESSSWIRTSNTSDPQRSA